MGRSLDLQPLNPLDFHISQIWRHRIHHGYHSNVAPCAVHRNAGRRLGFVFFGGESPPRAHPVRRRRLGISAQWGPIVPPASGRCGSTSNFGLHSRLAPGGCRLSCGAQDKRRVGFLDLTTAGLLRFSCGLSFLSVRSSPDLPERSPGSIRGLGFFVKFALAIGRRHRCAWRCSSHLGWEHFVAVRRANAQCTHANTTRRCTKK